MKVGVFMSKFDIKQWEAFINQVTQCLVFYDSRLKALESVVFSKEEGE